MKYPAISITERSEQSDFALDDIDAFVHRSHGHDTRRLSVPFNRLLHVLLHAWHVAREMPGVTEIVLRFPER